MTYFNTTKNINDAFGNLVLYTLGKMAPIKQKYIIGSNQSAFTNKDIHKAIMTGTRLRNRFLKKAAPINRQDYKKQRNYCVSSMRENKKTILWFLEC